ncbi:hypothetical protein AB0I35_31050 [Nocardia sp. NPDC050378]|uniref:hypothetical protein n=1 Tax=Nocardia sp. NPDC050378 TaxID=3155400 RepID=UPI0033DF36D7
MQFVHGTLHVGADGERTDEQLFGRRAVPVGDAAYAPSFLTGQGSSLALVGAYMLAESLAAHDDHATAFTAYERAGHPFVELNQAQISTGEAALFPTTAEALQARNRRLRDLTMSAPTTGRPAHTALTLPDVRRMAS